MHDVRCSMYFTIETWTALIERQAVIVKASVNGGTSRQQFARPCQTAVVAQEVQSNIISNQILIVAEIIVAIFLVSQDAVLSCNS